jgi:hypothetical protein
MDPSHVQEFTATSLEHTLRSYFASVDLYFQSVPGFWRGLLAGRLLELSDVSFDKVSDNPEQNLDAFALFAVCREPRF